MTNETVVEGTQEVEVKENNEMAFDTSITNAYTSKTAKQTYTEDKLACNLVMDVGASETRSLMLLPGKPVSGKSLRVTDSRYALIDLDEDLEVYKKVSEDISENGEYTITEDPNSMYIDTSWFKDTKRVLKGSLISKIGKAPRNIDNQRDKSEDIGMFINILTTIANRGLEHGTEKLKVKIGFPIPPKERYSDSKRIEKLQHTVAGNYTVTLPRYNYTCHIEIDPADVVVEAEGEAAFIYYTTRGEDARERYQEYSDKLVTIQDLGSSTFNIGLIDSGSIQSGVSHTAKMGGENLISRFYSILLRSRKEPINFEQAKKAVETGYISLGAQVIPVGVELTKAKTEIAELAYKEYITFLQISGLHSTGIYAHLFVGRGMLQTGEIDGDGKPSDNFSPSIGQILHQMYAEMSPNTKAIILTNPGLANLLGIASVMKIQWKL